MTFTTPRPPSSSNESAALCVLRSTSFRSAADDDDDFLRDLARRHGTAGRRTLSAHYETSTTSRYAPFMASAAGCSTKTRSRPAALFDVEYAGRRRHLAHRRRRRTSGGVPSIRPAISSQPSPRSEDWTPSTFIEDYRKCPPSPAHRDSPVPARRRPIHRACVEDAARRCPRSVGSGRDPRVPRSAKIQRTTNHRRPRSGRP